MSDNDVAPFLVMRGMVRCAYCGLIQRTDYAQLLDEERWACQDEESCAEGWAGQKIGLCP